MKPTLQKICAALFLFCTPLAAIADPTACTYLDQDDASCVRFAGCVNDGVAHFFGTSIGWHKGTLHGQNSNGAICKGEWTFNNFIRKGQGTMACEDGRSARISFFARSKEIHVITGVAISDQGDRMSMWTGANLLEYLEQTYPDGAHPGFQCGANWVKLPDVFPGPD